MGKLKNLAYSCWEAYSCNRNNPDWEKIGKDNNVTATTAKNMALGWEEEMNRQEREHEPEWIG